MCLASKAESGKMNLSDSVYMGCHFGVCYNIVVCGCIALNGEVVRVKYAFILQHVYW